VGLCVFIAPAVSANTELGPCSLNGINLSADIRVGYDGSGSTIANDYTQATEFSAVPIVAGGATAGNVVAAALKVPDTGSGKDRVNGELKAFFEFGTPVGSATQDTLQLEAVGNGSAEVARNTAGFDSDAVVTGQARAEFFIDIVDGVDCDTILTVPAIRNLLPHETFLEILIVRDPGGAAVTTTLSAGSPATTVILPEGFSYLIELGYDLRVPFGVDPPFFFTIPIAFGVAPVPGLGMEALIFVGLTLMIAGVVFQERRAKA
jgi:hypothetical protein